MKTRIVLTVLLGSLIAAASGEAASAPLAKLRAVPFTDVRSRTRSGRRGRRPTGSPPSRSTWTTSRRPAISRTCGWPRRRPPAASRGPVFMDSDVYKALEAAAYSLATHPDPALDEAARRDHRHARRGPAAGRLPQQLLHGEGAGQALDQPARLARALLRRAHVRGRRRPLPGHRQDELPERRAPSSPTTSTPCSARRPSAWAIPAIRRSSWRWSSSGAPPASSATSTSRGSSSRTAGGSSSPRNTRRRWTDTTAATGRTTCRSASTRTSRATPCAPPT